ncbi:MAG: glycoside hydrolase family 27 protein, partial [Planctomycetota bacterium]|nr:glycoside hydrolase family 27 protein [Planctomycetota bacterium]
GRGRAARTLTLRVGGRIALAPPMGWNSWNCWGNAVDSDKIGDAARGMVDSGLAHHGWSYVNIDDCWQGWRGPPEYALAPKERLADMAALADDVHARGLRLGIYSSPWKTTYAGYPGGSADTDDGRVTQKAHAVGPVTFEEADARRFADWGVDYLKYDWHPIDLDHARAMGGALRACGRDVVYSLSNNADPALAPDLATVANCWRTTGDIADTWESVAGIGFAQERWRRFAGPGHWNDPDMLVVGRVGWGPNLRPTRLTPNEQVTHISLWCLLAAPLLLGCDLTNLDDFTLGLLTNDEVLAVNQDPLGRQAGRVRRDGPAEAWAKPMADGSVAVGLFNRDDKEPREVAVTWKDLGLKGPCRVRDLWRQREVGTFDRTFAARVLVHGAVLVRVEPVSR